jgi:hypothetical protein
VTEGTDWVEQARRLVAGLGESGLGQAWADARGRVLAEDHEPGGDCRWCPVCQFATVARRPEVSEALADALSSAATALRALAAAAAETAGPDPAGPAATGDETAGQASAPPPAPVQHIEIA